MHYANGREAKNGDRVLRIAPEGYYGKPIIGILHDAVAGNDSCNGNLAAPVNDMPGCNLAECLHMDDVRAKLGNIKSVRVYDVGQPSVEDKAEIIYTAYCAAVGGKAFNGDTLPDWKTFAADPAKSVQANAWKTAAAAI